MEELNLEQEQKEMKSRWDTYNKKYPKAAARQLDRDEKTLAALRNPENGGMALAQVTRDRLLAKGKK